jgi:hypothetical protein
MCIKPDQPASPGNAPAGDGKERETLMVTNIAPIGTEKRSRSVASRVLGAAVALAGLAWLGACTSTQSQNETGGQMLPQPQVVIVDRFATSPAEVELDEGLSSEVEEAVKAHRGDSRSEQELQVGHEVADALADKLVVEIRDLGLPAERGTTVPPGQTGVLIKGQFVSIDEGNRTERVLIGLGAGRSDVRVHTQVYEVTPSGRQLVDQIEVNAKSGLTPGMAETMGAGGLAGHLLVSTAVSGGLHVVSETMGSNVVADTDRAAKGIAKQLAGLFAEQGWTR